MSQVRSVVAGRIAAVLVSAFIAILAVLHLLKPELQPWWRMISEYEIGRLGWMMRVAFFCWGGGVLALVIATWPFLDTGAGKVARWWLMVIGMAMIGAGVFATNAITDTVQSTSNTLHVLCGAIVIMTLPIAATLAARSLRRNGAWAPMRPLLLWATVGAWLAMLAYFGSIIISGAINPDAGRVGPHVYQGWPNRLMVLVYSAWLVMIACGASRASRDNPVVQTRES